MDNDNKQNSSHGSGQEIGKSSDLGDSGSIHESVVYNSGNLQNQEARAVNDVQQRDGNAPIGQESAPLDVNNISLNVGEPIQKNIKSEQLLKTDVSSNKKILGALVGNDSVSVGAEESKSNINPYGVTLENNKRTQGFNKVKLIKFLVMFALVIVLGTLAFVAYKYKRADGDASLGRKGEIVWWGINLDEVDVRPLIEEYKSENKNINITYIKQSKQDYRERLTNSIASGRGPDIFEIHNSWPQMFRNDLSSLPDSVMSKDEYNRTYYPVIIKDLTAEKGIVGIPLEYDAITLYINEDIFVSSAMQPPKTWDQVRNIAGALTQMDNRGIIIQSGIAIGITNNVDYWPEVIALMMLQNRVNLAHPGQQLAIDALNYYLLFRKDKYWNEILPPSTLAFANGRLAMYFGPTKSAFEILKRNPNLRFRTVLLPQLTKDDLRQSDLSYATYWAQAVWEKSSNKQESWKFLKYLSSRESLENLSRNIRISTNLQIMSPRMESANMYVEDPILGSIAALATKAHSWYLADATYDGITGINSQFNEIFRNVIEEGARGNTTIMLREADGQVKGLLSKYGIGW